MSYNGGSLSGKQFEAHLIVVNLQRQCIHYRIDPAARSDVQRYNDLRLGLSGTHSALIVPQEEFDGKQETDRRTNSCEARKKMQALRGMMEVSQKKVEKKGLTLCSAQ